MIKAFLSGVLAGLLIAVMLYIAIANGDDDD